jgi:hypothetical protein
MIYKYSVHIQILQYTRTVPFRRFFLIFQPPQMYRESHLFQVLGYTWVVAPPLLLESTVT